MNRYVCLRGDTPTRPKCAATASRFSRSSLAPARRLSLDGGKSRRQSPDMGRAAWEERARDTEFHVARHGIHRTMIITAPATSDHDVTIRCSSLSFATQRRATSGGHVTLAEADLHPTVRSLVADRCGETTPGDIPVASPPPGSRKRINKGSGHVH